MVISFILYTLDAFLTITKTTQYFYDLSKDDDAKKHLYVTLHGAYLSAEKLWNRVRFSMFKSDNLNADWIILEESSNKLIIDD
jgi:hypothetical protein